MENYQIWKEPSRMFFFREQRKGGGFKRKRVKCCTEKGAGFNKREKRCWGAKSKILRWRMA